MHRRRFRFAAKGSKHTVLAFVFRAKPTAANPTHFEWQTATIIGLIASDNPMKAALHIRALTAQQSWQPLEELRAQELTEEKALRASTEVRSDYIEARTGRPVLRVVHQTFMPGRLPNAAIIPQRVDEEFITRVVVGAGGTRLGEHSGGSGPKVTDYRIGNILLELKDLQEEVLDKPEHQRKIAEIFSPYRGHSSFVKLDPNILSKEDVWRFFDVLSTPLKSHVKKASSQVKATRKSIGDETLEGALLVVNTGLDSLTGRHFIAQVERYAKKDSQQFKHILSLHVECVTDGMSTYVMPTIHPQTSDVLELQQLRSVFEQHFEALMTEAIFRRPGSENTMLTAHPIAFTLDGVDYAWSRDDSRTQ